MTVSDNQLSPLLILCRKLIEDGVVHEGEARELRQWLAVNKQAASRFPGAQIAARLDRIFADGVISNEEREDLLHLLRKATREPSTTTSMPAPSQLQTADISTLPFSEEKPEFLNKNFVLLGNFVTGSRGWCQHQIAKRGGEVQLKADSETNYIVIGAGGISPAELESAKSNEITAVYLREETWVKALA